MEKQDSLNFLDGLRSGVSLAVGYIPVALTFGLLAKTTGLSLFETFTDCPEGFPPHEKKASNNNIIRYLQTHFIPSCLTIPDIQATPLSIA